jgi:hypothetical protein
MLGSFPVPPNADEIPYEDAYETESVLEELQDLPIGTLVHSEVVSGKGKYAVSRKIPSGFSKDTEPITLYDLEERLEWYKKGYDAGQKFAPSSAQLP